MSVIEDLRPPSQRTSWAAIVGYNTVPRTIITLLILRRMSSKRERHGDVIFTGVKLITLMRTQS